MNPVIIRSEHLGKRYRIGPLRRRRDDSAREAIASALAGVGRRLRAGSDGPPDATLWALDDVSFEVRAGETVGIIGRNGAGKSTLLKVISQITDPTRGFVDVTGRVGSLLEVGTGFHGDLSGRENTYLNGAILGMKKKEIDRKFDEIVAFAEVERFIDTPVKYYSSGMYMRLAFAVAAHLETEILVIDEVLAVGDTEFQKKCLGKMDDIARHGRTILFISHNLEAVQRLCGRGLLLDRGNVAATGPIADVVSQYRALGRRLVAAGRFNPAARMGSGWARISDLSLIDEDETPVAARAADEDLTFDLRLDLVDRGRHGASLRGLVVELVICSAGGQPLVNVMNVDRGGGEMPAAYACRVRARIDGPALVPGAYRVNAFVGFPHLEHVDEIPDALEFEVMAPLHPWRPYQMLQARGPVVRQAQWLIEKNERQV
jgi:homopolymeric O-antigen transport system ATP-binding protein